MKRGSTLKDWRDVLADLYPTEEDARQAVFSAGLDHKVIEFGGKAINFWTDILRYASSNDQVKDLIRVAREQHPRNEELAVAEQEWLAGRQPGGVPVAPTAGMFQPGPVAPEPQMSPQLPTPPIDEFTVQIERYGRIRARLARANGTPAPPATSRVPEDQLLLRSINSDRAKLRAGKLVEQEDLRSFGRALYAAVLPGEVGTLLERAVQRVVEEQFRAKQDWRLRVVVEVDPESKVFDWPLELLYYDDGKERGWLATEDLPILFSRRTQFTGRKASPPERPPLRVLVVVSNPLDGGTSEEILREMGALAAAASEAGRADKKLEFRVLGDEVGTGGTGLIDGIEYAGRPEWRRMVELGEDGGGWRPHVLHFIGHGKYEEAGKQGWLALVKDDEVDWCSAGDLIRALRNWGLRVVVLQACEKAQSGTEPAFMSLVDDLVRADIPAVVATQLSMTNRCAIEFAKGFYRALLEGSEVDRAVQRGRHSIYRDVRGSSPAFGAPVLFTYHPAGIIEPAAG